jgi:N-sulfoglucosamine sulfohydrolase
MPDGRPNVLFLVLEDTSPRFGCYGDRIAETPNVDALAAEGRRYDNCFATAGVCAPSRAGLVTGCHPTSIGAHHMRTTHTNEDAPALPTPYETVPPHYVSAFTEPLRRAGYCCTLDSKADYQFGEPFTMWDEHGEGVDWRTDRREAGQPFFAMLTRPGTHESGMWDPEHDGPGVAPVEDLTTDPAVVDVPPWLPDTEPVRQSVARQYDQVAAADEWVGAVLDRLAADGHAEDTVVVLTSDHGEGLPRAKRWPYDAGIHVPLVVRRPGHTEGGASDALVSLVDLAPTALSLAGVDVPRYVEGRPFLGPDRVDREYVFATRDRYDESYDMVRAVRDRRYKYVRHYYPGQPYVQWIPYRNRHPAMRELLRLSAAGDLEGVAARFMADVRPAEELYDIRADPHETENLVDDSDHADALERLRSALDDWQARTDDAGLEDERSTVERGWPGGEQPTTATPRFIPNAAENRGAEPVEDATLSAPATLRLHCSTQGASVGYTLDGGEADEETHWRLFDGPIQLPEGETTIRAKAVRYGYAESPVASATLRVS